MNQDLLKDFLLLVKEMEKGKVVLYSKKSDKLPQPVKMFCVIKDKKLIFNNVKSNNVPILKINDLATFMEYLEELVDIRMDFYHRLEKHFSLEAYKKVMMYTIFSSMTENDLENPVKFLKDKIKAYQNPLLENSDAIPIATTSFLNNKEMLTIKRMRTTPNCETPYAYLLELKDYSFPLIYADVVDNRLIVKGIQRIKGTNGGIQSKLIEKYLKDYLPKTNERYLRNVTPSFVVALDLFLESAKKLTNNQIDYLEIPTYCPILYHTREKIVKNDKDNNLGYRTTNKLIYTALRLEDYKKDCEVVDYGDVGSYIKMKIKYKEKIRELYPIYNENVIKKR